MSTQGHIELVIAADEPALFYVSAAAAERDLEAIDVRNGEYGPIYGRHGEVYRIDAVQDRVVIVHDKSKPADPEGLRRLLTDFLGQAMPEAELGTDLDGLLRQCEPYLAKIR